MHLDIGFLGKLYLKFQRLLPRRITILLFTFNHLSIDYSFSILCSLLCQVLVLCFIVKFLPIFRLLHLFYFVSHVSLQIILSKINTILTHLKDKLLNG